MGDNGEGRNISMLGVNDRASMAESSRSVSHDVHLISDYDCDNIAQKGSLQIDDESAKFEN